MFLHQVKKKRRRIPFMTAETIDAGLWCTAAERKNDERILVQIRGISSGSLLTQRLLL